MKRFVETAARYRLDNDVDFDRPLDLDFPARTYRLDPNGPSVKPNQTPDLLIRFAAIVGDKYAITDPREQEPYLVEWRDLYRGRTPLILKPGSVAEVSAILSLASQTGTAIVPQGGNTGLVGGQIPFDQEILVSLTRLNKIREIDPASSTMICEAGVVLQTAQQAAVSVNRLFPLSLGAEGSCTIGGNLSTNAGGTGVLAYGNARSLVLGLEVVLADGRVMNNLSKLKKDNTGYDLTNLFVGAEGTLGIITAATLKLFPRPRSVETAWIGVPSTAAALELFNLAQERAGGCLTGYELIARIAVEFALKHGPSMRDPLAAAHQWYVLLELSAQTEGLRPALEGLLEAGLERGIVGDAVIAENLDQANAFWHMRTVLTEVQKYEGGSIKHDVSVPVSAVPAFIDEASAAVTAMFPGCRPVPFGHLGDGNIHYNVSQPEGGDRDSFIAQWDAMNTLVHGIVARYNGSISAEHGIGRLKRHLLPEVKDPVALDLMRALKRTLDPKGILNPGKVL